MTYYLAVDGNYVGDFCTNSGIILWSNWLESMNLDTRSSSLEFLREFGYTINAQKARAQLEELFQREPPTNLSVKSTVENLLNLLKDVPDGAMVQIVDGANFAEEPEPEQMSLVDQVGRGLVEPVQVVTAVKRAVRKGMRRGRTNPE